jgi:hypothetical protein
MKNANGIEINPTGTKRAAYFKALEYAENFRTEVNNDVMKDAILGMIFPIGESIFNISEEIVLTLCVEDDDGTYISGVSLENVSQENLITSYYDDELQNILEYNWDRLYYQNLGKNCTFRFSKSEFATLKENKK